jgi:superfamily II DNA or RNA helicase
MLAQPDVLVWDECHHIASKSWGDIATAFPAAVHIGLTATPQRLDGKGLGAYFDTIIQGPTTADLIAQGWLSPYRYYAPSSANLAGVHRVAGDYNRRELAGAMEQSSVVGDALSHYQAHCEGGRALVFAWSVEASERIAAQFVAAGIAAQHVDGETPKAARSAAMKGFRDGSVRVLCNVELFGEGLDVPACDAVFLLRPTQSLGLYLQQVGRGLRTAPGKSAVRIFDHAGHWERHGLPDDNREWSLSDASSRGGSSESLGAKRCSQCFGVFRPGVKACPYCGAVPNRVARDVAQVEGTLEAVNVAELRALREQRSTFYRDCHTLADWFALAKRLGYKRGWGFHMHARSIQHRKHRNTAIVNDYRVRNPDYFG